MVFPVRSSLSSVSVSAFPEVSAISSPSSVDIGRMPMPRSETKARSFACANTVALRSVRETLTAPSFTDTYGVSPRVLTRNSVPRTSALRRPARTVNSDLFDSLRTFAPMVPWLSVMRAVNAEPLASFVIAADVFSPRRIFDPSWSSRRQDEPCPVVNVALPVTVNP